MIRISFYLIKSYLGPFMATFFVALFVLVMQFLWKYVDELVGKGLEWYVIGQLFFYASANLVPLALPLAILLSSLMLFGTLGEDFELVAMKSAGISLQRIMLPLLFVSIAISGIAFYFSNNIWPIANLKMGTILWDVRQQKPAFHLKPGIFYNGIEGYSIKAEKKTNDTTLENIIIYDHTAQISNNKVITARKGIMKIIDKGMTLEFTLLDGHCYDEQDNPKTRKPTLPHRRISFKSESIYFDLGSFKMERTSEDLFRDHYQMLNLAQIVQVSDSLRQKYRERQEEINTIVTNRYLLLNKDTQPATAPPAPPTPQMGGVGISPPFGGRGVRDGALPDSLRDFDLRVTEHAMNAARSNKAYISALKSELESRRELLVRYDIEWHRKFTLSIACLILFFVGAPLGTIIRKGGFGMPVVVSSLLFILFHVLSITGEKFSREGVLEPVYGMWMPSLFFLPFGILLTYKAANDSNLLNMETYSRFLKNIFYKKEPQ